MGKKKPATQDEQLLEHDLSEKLERLGVTDFAIKLGDDAVLLLYVRERLIAGASYALAMEDAHLQAFISETVGG